MSVEAETAGMSPYKGSKPKFWGVLHRECCCFVRGSWQRKREEPMRNDTGRLRAPTISGRDDYALDSHAPRPTGPYPPQRYADLGSNVLHLDGRQGVCRGLD